MVSRLIVQNVMHFVIYDMSCKPVVHRVDHIIEALHLSVFRSLSTGNAHTVVLITIAVRRSTPMT